MRRGSLFAGLLILAVLACCFCAAGAMGWSYFNLIDINWFADQRTATAPPPTASPPGSSQLCRDFGTTPPRSDFRPLVDLYGSLEEMNFFASAGNRLDTEFTAADGTIMVELTMEFP